MKFFEMPEVEIEKFKIQDVIAVSLPEHETDDEGEWN